MIVYMTVLPTFTFTDRDSVSPFIELIIRFISKSLCECECKYGPYFLIFNITRSYHFCKTFNSSHILTTVINHYVIIVFIISPFFVTK